MSRIMCEHIPSRQEVYEILKGFLAELKDKDIKYTTKDTDMTFTVTFPSTELGINFLKYVNYKKMQNRVFFKMRVGLHMINATPPKKRKSHLSPIKRGRDSNLLSHRNQATDKNNQGVKGSSRSIGKKGENNSKYGHLKTDESVHFLKKNLSPEKSNKHKGALNQISFSGIPRSKSNNKNKKKLQSKEQSTKDKKSNAFKKASRSKTPGKDRSRHYTIAEVYHECEDQMKEHLHPNIPLRISSPYLDQYMFDHIYNVDNKNKWISKKGFNSKSRAKPECNYISNYVFTTPSKLPQDFKYREVNRSKWVEKKGFVYKNGNDFLIKAGEQENERFYYSQAVNES